MRKIIFIIGILFCSLANSQIVNPKTLGTKNDSILQFGADKKTRYVPLSMLTDWVSEDISGGASDNQQLTELNDILSLENGGSVDLSKYSDQLITDFSLSGNILSITLEGNTELAVDLSSLSGGGSGGSDTAAQIVSKLESLTGNDRLDYSAIKNTPTFTDTNTTNSTFTNSRNGNDITITLTDSDSNPVSTTFTDLQSSGGGGSSSNLNEVIVSEISQLSNPVNNGKRLILQTNIDLQNGDYTLAENIELVSYGGSLRNYNSININGAKFYSDRIDRVIIDDSGTLTGTSNSKEIYCKWFGLTDTEDTNQYDNRNVFKNVARITAYTGSTVWVNPGHFYMSVVENERFTQPERPNVTIYGEVHWKGYGWQQTQIEVLPNDAIGRSVAFVTDHSENGSFEGIWLKGDLETTADQQNEFRSGLTITNESHGFKVLNNRLSHFTGDGLNHYSWDDFNNNFFVYEAGGIDDNGADEANLNTFRSALTNISPQGTQAGHAQLTGGSFGSYDTLSDFSYVAYFYDASGDFIDKTEYVFTYKDIPIPENATQIRTVISTPIGGVAPTAIQFRGTLDTKRVEVKRNQIDHNYRNGFSNPGQEWVITHNYFWYNGGRVGGPSYGFDGEDNYQGQSDIIIAWNTFENNIAGAITLRWVRNYRIENNTFLGKTDPLLSGKSDINARETWDTVLTNNYYYSTDISLGRYAKINGGTAYDSNITMANVDTQVNNLLSYNGGVKPAGDGVNAPGRSLVRNSTFLITRKLEAELFGNNITLENTNIQVDNDITFGSIGLFTNFSFNTTNTYKDYFKNINISGAGGESNERGISLVPVDIEDSDFSTGIYFQGGERNDIELLNNTYKQRISFLSLNTPYTIDGSDFKTVKIKSGILTIENGDVTNLPSGAAITTQGIDINLIIEDLVIDINDSPAYILGLNHNGYTIFKNCTFKSDVENTPFDLNRQNLGTTVTQVSSIIFENPTFENIDFTPRAIDKVVYSQSNSEMPFYANNSAAIDDGYPIGYYYRNASNSVNITVPNTLPTAARFIILGNSITQDVFADEAAVKSEIETAFNGVTVTIEEEGTDGRTSLGLANDISAILDNYSPIADVNTYCVISIGVNDVNATRPYNTASTAEREALETNIRAVVSEVESRGYIPIITEIYYSDYGTDTYNNQEVGSKPFNENIVHLLTTEISPEFTYAGGTSFYQGYNVFYNNRDAYFIDDLHPNGTGVTAFRTHFTETIARKVFTGTNPTIIPIPFVDSDLDGNPDDTDPNTNTVVVGNDSFDSLEGESTTRNVLENDDFIASSDITITDLGTGNAGGTVVFNNLTGEVTYTPLAVEVNTNVTIDYRVTYVPNSVSGDGVITINVLEDVSDPDANAFFTTTGITDTNIRTAITQYVTALKSNGTWSKYQAIWVFVGGTEFTHSINLKNPQDNDSAFRIDFNGTWIHDNQGSEPDGSTAYAETHLNILNEMTNYDIAYHVYSNEQNSTNGVDMGVANFGPRTMLSFQYANDIKFEMSGFGSPDAVEINQQTTTGYLIGSRVSDSDVRLYRNGVELAQDLATTTGTLPGNTLYLGAFHNGGSASDFSPRKIVFAAVSDGLTPTEVTNDTSAVNNLVTALNKN